MRSTLCVIVVILAAAQGAADANDKDPNEAAELLRTKWDAIISVLQNEQLDTKTKETQINEITSGVFDFDLMAKLALGKKNWPKLTGPQREKYTELFVERLKDSYRDKISLYADEQVLLKTPVQHKKSVYIPMDLISKEKTVAILYKFRTTDEKWKIYDVEIEGVSILLTYRSQFDDILSRGSVEDLLARLAKTPTD